MANSTSKEDKLRCVSYYDFACVVLSLCDGQAIGGESEIDSANALLQRRFSNAFPGLASKHFNTTPKYLVQDGDGMGERPR